MKKNIIFILLFFLLAKAEGQIVFCPTGAEWHYSFSGFNFSGPPLFLNEKIRYVRDSAIGNDIVKVLAHRRFYNRCNFPPSAITCIKQKGDTIFMRSASTQNGWQILYNFATLPGQSWTATINTSYTPSVTLTHTVTVDSVNFTTINNFVLKTLYVKYKFPYSSVQESATITERLGGTRFMFNYRNPSNWTDCEQAGGIICYQDSVFGLKQFSSYACDYQEYLGVQENNYQSANIKIYPNPANDFFAISTESELINEESIANISDLCGREIKQVTINDLNFEPGKVDISDLAKGVYILNLSNNNEIVYTGKLVKSD